MKNSHDHVHLKVIQHLEVYFYRTVLSIQANNHSGYMLTESNMVIGRIDIG